MNKHCSACHCRGEWINLCTNCSLCSMSGPAGEICLRIPASAHLDPVSCVRCRVRPERSVSESPRPLIWIVSGSCQLCTIFSLCLSPAHVGALSAQADRSGGSSWCTYLLRSTQRASTNRALSPVVAVAFLPFHLLAQHRRLSLALVDLVHGHGSPGS